MNTSSSQPVEHAPRKAVLLLAGGVIVILALISYGSYRWYQKTELKEFDAWYANQQQEEIARIVQESSQYPLDPVTDAEMKKIIADSQKPENQLPQLEAEAIAQIAAESSQTAEQVEAEKRNQAFIDFKNNR